MRISDRIKFIIPYLVAFGVLVGGFYLALHFCNPDWAGRAGAVAVALALLALFMNYNTPTRVYKILTEEAPTLRAAIASIDPTKAVGASQPVSTNDQIKAIEKLIKHGAEGQRKQNFSLAIPTFIATIIWGFGDLIAKFLIVLLYGSSCLK